MRGARSCPHPCPFCPLRPGPGRAALGRLHAWGAACEARPSVRATRRHAPPLPGTAVSSLAAWNEHLAYAATHTPALLPAGGGTAQQPSSSSTRSCGAKMKRTTD